MILFWVGKEYIIKRMNIHFDCQPLNSNKAISSIYTEMLQNSEQLNLRPLYQRSAVWDKDQKGNLIDSIMRNCPMPIFLIYAYVRDTNECIDGQNRLTAIKEYIEQDDRDPWAWVQEKEDVVEYIFYRHPKTAEVMSSYCEAKTRSSKGRSTKPKRYRLMNPLEVKTFHNYKCTFSEIGTKLTFEQRKDIFLRWQSGTGISQCDRFKNDNTPFCNFVLDQGLEHTLTPRIAEMLKTGRRNWLYDLYRLVHVFHEGVENNAPMILISTLKCRSRMKSTTDFSLKKMKNAVRRCETFIQRFSFLKKLQNIIKISFLLELAMVWNASPLTVRSIMEQEPFMLDFAETNLHEDGMNHNTLGDFRKETILEEAFPRFRTALLTACDKHLVKR